MGWTGTYDKWGKVLDLITRSTRMSSFQDMTVCGIDGAMEMKAYLEYVREESNRHFQRGLTALEASKRIDLGPYSAWRAPAAPLLERRAGVPGIPSRTGGQALGTAKSSI